MIVHYAQDLNIQSGTVEFNGVKTITVQFLNAFKRHPAVNLTFADDSAGTPAAKTSVSLTQFKIKLQSNYTGLISWMAVE